MPSLSLPLPPNPSLVAILLVIKTRTGPHVAFHYPPTPSTSSGPRSRDPAWYGTPGPESSHSDTSDSDWSADSDSGHADDDGSSKAASRGSGGKGSRHDTAGSTRSVKTRGTGAPLAVGDDVDEELLEISREKDVQNSRDSRPGDGGGKGEDRNEAEEWNGILGYGWKGLGKMLSPGRGFNKRRFELGIEHLVFLGAPRFVRTDGLWKKDKRRPRRKGGDAVAAAAASASASASTDAAVENRPLSETSQEGRDGNSSASGETPTNGSAVETLSDVGNVEFDIKNIPVFDPAYGHGLMSGAASEIGSETRSLSTNGSDNDLTMFNIIFVLNPPALEYHVRVDEMYENVVKKFAKALKYAQAQTNYVYVQSRIMQSIKEKGRENRTPVFSVWPTMIANSSLAKAIANTFETISQGKIAHVNLGNDFDTSFQIPQTFSTPYIPTATEPQMPGLWLTTASLLEDEDSEAMLSPHSALLLLEEDDTLLREVESDAKELFEPLSYFIRNLTPTKSLQRLAQMHSLSLRDVQLLARHLIYWRRARAIPPLRWQDTYIVSPNADMRALASGIPAYAARFPMLPSLPKMLHSLSGAPRPYSMLMPTKDHRTPYMEILAWLMRHGWVTQLRTFGWVRVPPEIKAAVAVKVEQESRLLKKNGDRSATSGSSPRAKAYTSSSERPADQGSEVDRSSSASPFRRENLPGTADSPAQTSPHLFARSSPSDTASVSSGRTAVTGTLHPFSSPLQRPQSSNLIHKPTPLHIVQTSPLYSNGDGDDSPPRHGLDSPVHGPASSTGAVTAAAIVNSPANQTASIIRSPQKANDLEARWIEHIESIFEDDELKELWPVMLRYFDGRHALEEISVRENLKKKRVGAALARLISCGWLMTVRHW